MLLNTHAAPTQPLSSVISMDAMLISRPFIAFAFIYPYLARTDKNKIDRFIHFIKKLNQVDAICGIDHIDNDSLRAGSKVLFGKINIQDNANRNP
jgi:hypothetical protein